MTDGDMLSHKAMYNTMKKAFPNMNVVSEEHDTDDFDLSKIEMPSLSNSELDSIAGDETVNIEDVTVWIDPLDATQERMELCIVSNALWESVVGELVSKEDCLDVEQRRLKARPLCKGDNAWDLT